MTAKEFSVNYGIPLNKVKAALHVSTEEAARKHFDEVDIISEMYCFLASDMRICIEEAAKANEMMKKIAMGMPPPPPQKLQDS